LRAANGGYLMEIFVFVLHQLEFAT
jgi:hypothetical protein